MRRFGVPAAIVAVVCLIGTSAASSHRTTPIPCGLVSGAPWKLVSSPDGRLHSGDRYYVYETSNLACRTVSVQVARLSRLRPISLLQTSVNVSTGERLHCLHVTPTRDVRSISPASAWGWCGTGAARVARLGVVAATGTEFFWMTADKNRGY